MPDSFHDHTCHERVSMMYGKIIMAKERYASASSLPIKL